MLESNINTKAPKLKSNINKRIEIKTRKCN